MLFYHIHCKRFLVIFLPIFDVLFFIRNTVFFCKKRVKNKEKDQIVELSTRSEIKNPKNRPQKTGKEEKKSYRKYTKKSSKNSSS